MCPRSIRRALGRCLIRTGRYCDACVPVYCDRLAWFAGPVLVLFGSVLILLLSVLGFVYIIPGEVKTYEAQILIKLILVLGVFNVCARYVCAVGTNPGTPSSSAYERALRERGTGSQAISPSLLAWTTCKRTGLPKPPRAHYDTVNCQLVMNFDHWCPWLFNSVGYGNYRHFLVFLFWIWMLTSLGVVLAAEPFFHGLKRGGLGRQHFEEVAAAIVFCLCFALSLAIGILFGWHVFLSMTAQTSVDFLVLHGRRYRIDEDYPNPFDSGSIWTNLKSVLFSEGGGWLELVWPPAPHRGPLGRPFPGAW